MNLSYDTYHVFEHEGNYYLFDTEQLISCIIDKHVYDALKRNDNTLLSDTELQMLETFHKHNIFFVDKPQKRYSHPQYDTVIISMALYHGCNLKCRYCFADSGDNFRGNPRCFTESSMIAAIEFLLNDAYFANKKRYRINLVGGGEPLLSKKLFKMFVELAFDLFRKAKKHLYVWFSTNGTLLSEEDLVFISKYNIGYGISIDGCKSDHDKLRVYQNSYGTYDDIVHNIHSIQNSMLVPKRLKELWGLMVYSRENSNLFNNLKHLRDLGFSTVQMRFVRSNDKTLVLSTNESAPKLLDCISSIFEQAIIGQDSLLRMISNDSDYLGKLVKRLVLHAPVAIRCGAGSCMFSFAADGYIYPCDCFVGNPEFVVGNFYNSILAERLEKYDDLSVYKRKKCKGCWAKNVCGGDCYHNSFIKNGNLLSPDDTYCEVILRVIEFLIAYINQYQLKNKDGFSAYKNFLQIREQMSSK